MNGARIRTLIVAIGLGFSAVALGSACLDYAGEDFGVCDPASLPPIATGVGSGTGPANLDSGTGSATPAPQATVDCGIDPLRREGGGSGSGFSRP
jgi:hypothetical protein